jgi:hypothetical protein
MAPLKALLHNCGKIRELEHGLISSLPEAIVCEEIATDEMDLEEKMQYVVRAGFEVRMGEGE